MFDDEHCSLLLNALTLPRHAFLGPAAITGRHTYVTRSSQRAQLVCIIATAPSA